MCATFLDDPVSQAFIGVNSLLIVSWCSSLFEDLPTAMLPMVWFSQEADMTSDIAADLAWAARAVDLGRWMMLVLGLVGLILIAFGMVLHCGGCFNQRTSTNRGRRR